MNVSIIIDDSLLYLKMDQKKKAMFDLIKIK
jgi:hypothetical protein